MTADADDVKTVAEGARRPPPIAADQSDDVATLAEGAARPITAGPHESGSDPMDSLASRLDDLGVLQRGATIGRYVALSVLGRGGMGIVYAAYDPELDRKVAVKLLLPQGAREANPEARLRLLREAQGLARLAHPNVVAVHDTGTKLGQVWLAMELVPGRTLKVWMQEQRHTWPEVLAVMIPAGTGLAAAHAAKLVHRDFKPDNVMLGDDGRVRVMDFGLVRTNTAMLEPPPESAGPAQLAPFAADLTAEQILGTPAYMPPEQWQGAGSDERGDQFSFCVALWEALYGERPFAAKGVKALGLAIMAGTRREPPARSAVPPWLRRAVERGMATRPEDRWPSMTALLAELQQGAGRGRKRWAAAAVLAAGLLAGGVAGVGHTLAARDRDACEAAGTAAAAIPDDRRAAIQGGLLATHSPFAEQAHRQIEPMLAQYAAELGAATTQSCLRGLADAAWPAARATACLAEARWSLDGLIDVFTTADNAAVISAAPAILKLPGVARCLDPAELARRPEVLADADARAQADTLRAELARIDAMALAGRYADGLAAAQALVPRADELGWAPLTVQARIALGTLLMHSPDPTAAEQPIEAAYLQAERSGERGLVVDAARALGLAIAETGRYDEALRWDRAAEAMAAGLGETESARVADILRQIGVMQTDRAAFPEAQQALERGLAMAERIHGPDHPVVGSLLTALSNLAIQRGDYAAAEALDERSLRLFTVVYGESHPLIAGLTTNLASARYMRGAYAEARQLNDHALAIWERTIGDRHPKYVGAQIFAGHLAVVRGDSDTARARYSRALALQEQMLGPDHPDLGTVLSSLGDLELACGRLPEAESALTRALQIRRTALGDDHVDTALPLLAVGELAFQRDDLATAGADYLRARWLLARDKRPDQVALVDLRLGELARTRSQLPSARQHYTDALQALEAQFGQDNVELADALVPLGELDLADEQLDAAAARFTRAREIVEKSLGSDHPGSAAALRGLAQVAIRRGDRLAARPLLERAVTLAARDCAYFLELAQSRFELAQLLWQDGDRDRSLTLAREAAAGIADSGARQAARHAEITTWLAQRSRG
mgnify:CR=1 FL=1